MVKVNLFSRFFSTTNILKSYGVARLYFWEPFAWGKTLSHPVYSYLIKGDVGHLSLEFEKHTEKSVYFSIWPEADPSDTNQDGDYIKKVKLSKNLQDDIEKEEGRRPLSKSIEISEGEYRALQSFIEKYRKTTKIGGAIDGGGIWSIKSNCADAVYDALQSAGLIVCLEPKILPRTPKAVYTFGFDKQEILLRNKMHEHEYR